MARAGRFGRQPRSAPSLTNALVAIAREFQAQRAENIMKAWEKGGTFEGQKATDELVLAFWRERAKGVSKDDPLYDTYNNAVTQLTYNIAESKMTADYAQKKVGDGAMVSFYMKWAKKLPRNSEAYRVLMRDAGQYMRNQRATSEGELRRRAEERYQRQQEGTKDKFEAAGEYAIDTFRRIAQSGNFNLGIERLIDAPGSGSDLTHFDPSDPAIMLKLIDAVTAQGGTKVLPNGFTVPEGKFEGTDSVLFHDDDGKAITGKAIMAQFAKLDPNFQPGTRMDTKYISGLLDRQMQGINERIQRANATGHMTDVSNLQQSKSYIAMLNRQVEAYPVQKLYQEARADWMAVANDDSASPMAVMKAWKVYQSTLTGLASDKRIEANDAMRSSLMAEANMSGTGPTLSESFTGDGGRQSSFEANAQQKALIERIQTDTQTVLSTAMLPDTDPNKVFWTYGTYENGTFTPSAAGRQLGAATQEQVNAGGGGGMKTMVVDDPRGGNPIQVAVTATPVYGMARNPQTGKVIPSAGTEPLAMVYHIPNGAQTKVIYGFQTADGKDVFSDDPPWKSDLKPQASTQDGRTQFVVDFTPLLQEKFGAVDPATGLRTDPFAGGKKDIDFQNGFRFVADAKDPSKGEIQFNAVEAGWLSDDRMGTAQADPTSDFRSLTMASLVKDPEGFRILSNLDKYPAFRTQLDNDHNAYAGSTWDPKLMQWNQTTADPTRLQEVQRQQAMGQSAKDFMGFVTQAANTWRKDITGSATMFTEKPGSTNPIQNPTGLLKLATDLVQNTPFAALGNAFKTGSTERRFAGKEEDDRFTIKPVSAIKAPVIKTSSTTKVTTQPGAGQTSVYQPPTTSTPTYKPPTPTYKPPTNQPAHDLF